MTVFVKLAISLVMITSNLALAQIADDYKYELSAGFERRNAFNEPLTRFILKWNETQNEIKGVYSDNYFATTDVPVVGIKSRTGRSFSVILPDLSRGAKTLDIQSQAGSEGSIGFTFSVKDASGVTRDYYTLTGTVSSDPTAAEVADAADPQIACVVGMGALTGYCGTYAGRVSKESDEGIHCQESIISDSKLELNDRGDFKLHLEQIISVTPRASTIGEEFTHNLGGFNGAGPVTTSVNVSNRYCGKLMGTNSPPENCQLLNLNGSFTNTAGVRTFRGTYTIRDLVTSDACTFALVMDRQ